MELYHHLVFFMINLLYSLGLLAFFFIYILALRQCPPEFIFPENPFDSLRHSTVFSEMIVIKFSLTLKPKY